MKFQLTRTSDYHNKDFIELNTLEELLAFVDKEGNLIISSDGKNFAIEIYDDYRE